MKNILFYKYVNIKDPDVLKEEQFKLAESLNLFGTILVADEGINGCLSGKEKDLEKFKIKLINNSRFFDIKFKESSSSKHTFKKLHVRVRDEIVSSKFDVHIKNKAPYIEPKQLRQLLDKNEDIIMLDARNNYEFDLGKFKDAIHLDLDTFRQFPTKIKELENNNKIYNNHKNKLNKKLLKTLKNKKIITYCTGGVRCEKASAFLKENGFNDVYQLHGGILTYGKECGNSHWQGKCFVFDTRGAIDIDSNSESKPITQCVLCNLPNADLHDCALTSCDKFFTACENCFNVLDGCCSKRCSGDIVNNIKN